MSPKAVTENGRMFKRYAVYVTLPDGPLARFGAAWLGWDVGSGAAVTHPHIGLDIEPLTRTPRKYGLHGTIKPPFRLASGTTAERLDEALATFCADRAPVTLDGLKLARLGGFLALVPAGNTAALSRLAGDAVQQLDPFRAPPSDAELTRRRAKGLSPAQEAHLSRWGYPYVLDEFRFHITLTGALDADSLARTEAALSAHVTPLLPQRYRIDRLTLCGEDGDGHFHALHHHALGG